MNGSLRHASLAVGGSLLLSAATPPAWFPGAEFLVVLGLALHFAVATTAARPLWSSYLLGCVCMATFSWSTHHVLWFAYAAIVLLGGGYFVLTSAVLRTAPSAWRAPVFALASAAGFWLRSVMPEIYYPHGQPAHCWWQWPELLGAVTVGGEVLLNALLALLAAALAEAWASWRTAVVPWPRARNQLAGAAALFVVSTLVGEVVHRRNVAVGGELVRVATIEPGLHPVLEFAGLSEKSFTVEWRARFRERLVEPTRALLADAVAPELVLWPESSIYEAVPASELANGPATARALRTLAGVLPASDTQLLLGANVQLGDDRMTPAAFLVDLPKALIVGHQEKRALVPGGEFPPLFALLPAAAGRWIRDTFASVMRMVPDGVPGRELPPLRTRRGVPFGVLLCYDNAFPGPAAAQVAAGARFLTVLSNESWFQGGDQLRQLVAMSVLRARETATPLVRCTQDGWTVAIGGDGRLLSELPPLVGRQPASRILRVDLPLGAGRELPMASLRAAAGPFAALASLLVLLHGCWRWAKLRAARTASRAAATGVPGGERSGS